MKKQSKLTFQMPPAKPQKKSLQVNIDENLLEEFRNACDENSQTQTEVIVYYLEKYIEMTKLLLAR